MFSPARTLEPRSQASSTKGTASPFFQAKPTVNTPGDAHEQEADRVADQVMRMREGDAPIVQRMPLTPVDNLQRKCVGCENEEKEKVQRKERSNDAGGHAAPSIVGDVLSSDSGQPMDGRTRQFMESRFGQDFSQVRIHTGGRAAESAAAIQARAYTSGRDVVFGKGEYQPDSEGGRRLLAHELVHVGQQDSNTKSIQRYEGFEHQYFGDGGLTDLNQYAQTKDGAEWLKKYGYDAKSLSTDIENDPFYSKKAGEGAKVKTENANLTPGQIIALHGDFYADPNKLNKAKGEEVQGILSIIKKEEKHDLTAGEATIKYEEITGGRYLKLAEQNDEHFAKENKRAWLKRHQEAIALIRQKPNDDKIFNKALLIDASGGHFLTDSFAAGHLLDKKEVLISIRTYLKSNKPAPKSPEMQTYLDITSSKHDQLALKNIHDYFNRMGFIVSNDKGMKWKTFGDGNLERAPETKRIASLAIFLSRQHLYRVKKDPKSVINSDEVYDLMPNDASVSEMTKAAIAYIPTAVDDIADLIYRNRDASQLAVGEMFAPIVQSNLSAIGSPARFAQLQQALTLSQLSGLGPIFVPQFELCSFDSLRDLTRFNAQKSLIDVSIKAGGGTNGISKPQLKISPLVQFQWCRTPMPYYIKLDITKDLASEKGGVSPEVGIKLEQQFGRHNVELGAGVGVTDGKSPYFRTGVAYNFLFMKHLGIAASASGKFAAGNQNYEGGVQLRVPLRWITPYAGVSLGHERTQNDPNSEKKDNSTALTGTIGVEVNLSEIFGRSKK